MWPPSGHNNDNSPDYNPPDSTTVAINPEAKVLTEGIPTAGPTKTKDPMHPERVNSVFTAKF